MATSSGFTLSASGDRQILSPRIVPDDTTERSVHLFTCNFICNLTG